MQPTRPMTPSERRAYDSGVRAAIDAARLTALTIETTDDANTFRKRVAAEALAAFAEGAKGLMLETAAPCSMPDVNRASDHVPNLL